MSTRYVWGKYKLKAEPGGSMETLTEDSLQVGTDYKPRENGWYELSGSIKTLAHGGTAPANPYRYLRNGPHVIYPYTVESGDVWSFSQKIITVQKASGGTRHFYFLQDAEPDDFVDVNSLIGNMSSARSNAYQKTDVNEDFRYGCKYLGSDNIDPSAIRYSKSELEAGESITVSVTPRTPTYGGTVYYQYQYSTNGGSSWLNSGGKTTGTSKTITVPAYATQFQVQVIASDGWGFTSTTPVIAANLKVIARLTAYGTVSGTHRAGAKLFATVDGKAREITKGFATVDGVIRKLF